MEFEDIVCDKAELGHVGYDFVQDGAASVDLNQCHFKDHARGFS